MTDAAAIKRTGPAGCEVGDWFTIEDLVHNGVEFGREDEVSWQAGDGQPRRFKLVEVPIEGGTDFAYRRIA